MFNPLGGFDPNSALLADALIAARSFDGRFPTEPAGSIRRGYFHWAVAPFGCTFVDYDAMVDLRDGAWQLIVTGNIAANAAGDQVNEASHTWHRNSHAFGLAIGGMDGATTSNFGKDPVQLHELHYLCAGMAAACKRFDIDTQAMIVGPSGPEHTLLTHAEVAVLDDYAGERWDLGTLVPLPPGVALTPSMRSACGDALRALTHRYKAALL